jgi:hypothetical protein
LEFIKCSKCGSIKGVDSHNLSKDEIFRGTIYCRCGETIFFELEGSIITFVTGKHPFGGINRNVPEDASDRLAEAKLCYFSGALRASAVMARSSIERGLSAKGYDKGKLEQRIEAAHNDDKNIIGDVELALAHGTRLIGNDAIHEAQTIAPVEVEGALGATVQILNKMFSS